MAPANPVHGDKNFSGRRFCLKHGYWVDGSLWSMHAGCSDRKASNEAGKETVPMAGGMKEVKFPRKSKQVRAFAAKKSRHSQKKRDAHGALLSGMEEKRVSQVVKYCPRHGKFTGYQWGPHKKVCRLTEVTMEEYDRVAGLHDAKAKQAGTASNGNLSVDKLAENLNLRMDGLRDLKKDASSRMKEAALEIAQLEKRLISAREEFKKEAGEIEKIGNIEEHFLSRIDRAIREFKGDRSKDGIIS